MRPVEVRPGVLRLRTGWLPLRGQIVRTRPVPAVFFDVWREITRPRSSLGTIPPPWRSRTHSFRADPSWRKHRTFRTSIRKPRPPSEAISSLTMRPASDLAALQQGVHIALSLALLKAVFGRELGHEIVLAFEAGQILLGKLAPLRGDFLEDGLPSFG